MSDWERRLIHALQTLHEREPGAAIRAIADLAHELSESQGDAYLEGQPEWRQYEAATRRLYSNYIVEMETQEVARLLALPTTHSASFMEMASERGRVSYQRVSDMLDQVDFRCCNTFVMVGCGQLPVTALHVMERTDVTDIVLLDVSSRAVQAVELLRGHFGWNALHALHCDGKDFDFGRASVVYVGNMVTPKLATVERLLATAPEGVQIVVREPYSLGRLWADKMEPLIAADLRLLGRGPVSRHLSRDLYLRRISDG